MELSTEEKILAAAKEVFTKKGFAAARMQEIADTAKINKGLLHYYFKSKDKLFRAVFDKAFAKFALTANRIFNADIPLFEKIETFVNEYMDILTESPYMPSFVISELNQNPEEFVKDLMSRENRPTPFHFLGQVQMEVQTGRIRKINPLDLLLNMLGLCVFPFLARPMFQGITGLDNDSYMKLMANRKKEIIDFIINGIKASDE